MYYILLNNVVNNFFKIDANNIQVNTGFMYKALLLNPNKYKLLVCIPCTIDSYRPGSFSNQLPNKSSSLEVKPILNAIVIGGYSSEIIG